MHAAILGAGAILKLDAKDSRETIETTRRGVAVAAVGDAWLASGRSALLRVPSFAVAESANVLANPLHRDAAKFAIVSLRPFAFDARLWPSP